MAKRDISRDGKIFYRHNKYAKYSCDIRMTQIDCETRKKLPHKPGIRQIVLDAYKEKGYMGAMIALKAYNDRVKRTSANKDKSTLPLYSLEQMKDWIAEYEKNGKGVAHDGDSR